VPRARRAVSWRCSQMPSATRPRPAPRRTPPGGRA
jgi:hypothetical protein